MGRYYQFGKVVEASYPIEHVYPIKQKDLVYILDHLPREVDKVYVFGSCLTLDCGRESDIDLLVVADKSDELYKGFSQIFKEIDNEVDLLVKTHEEFNTNLSDENSICNVVKKAGWLVYERPISTS